MQAARGVEGDRIAEQAKAGLKISIVFKTRYVGILGHGSAGWPHCGATRSLLRVEPWCGVYGRRRSVPHPRNKRVIRLIAVTVDWPVSLIEC